MLRRGNGGSDYAGTYHGHQPRHAGHNRNRCSPAPPLHPSYPEVSRGLGAPGQTPCPQCLTLSIGPSDVVPLMVLVGMHWVSAGMESLPWPPSKCIQSISSAVTSPCSQAGTLALEAELVPCPSGKGPSTGGPALCRRHPGQKLPGKDAVMLQ